MLLLIAILQFIPYQPKRLFKPLLVNERNLILDVTTLIYNNTRLDLSSKLLDTSYSTVGENLLLDLNLHFEEHLQEAIENNQVFVTYAKEIADIIHQSGLLESAVNLDMTRKATNHLKEQRYNWIAEYIFARHEYELMHQFDFNGVEDFKKALNSKSFFNLNKNFTELYGIAQKDKCRGYLDIIQMINYQTPSNGGTVEYAYGSSNNLLYWLYHYRTLAKDPDRDYNYMSNSTEAQKKLRKPIIDYRTHKNGLIPIHNQRNLGTGVYDVSFDIIPKGIKTQMIKVLNLLGKKYLHPDIHEDIYDYKYRLDLLINKFQFKPTEDNTVKDVEEIWKKCNNNRNCLIIFYNEVLRLGLSSGLKKIISKEEIEQLTKIEKTFKTKVINVIGVRENILLTPVEAAKQLEIDLTTRFGENNRVPKDTFRDSGITQALDYSYYCKDLQLQEEKWYINSRKSFKPIIGGASGHTLNNLNLYQSALEVLPKLLSMKFLASIGKFPSFELFRFIILGGIIGRHMHHSYDEIITPSHGFYDPIEKKKLYYEYKQTYGDVLLSKNKEIRKTSELALKYAIEELNDSGKNDVDYLIKTIVFNNDPDKSNKLKSYCIQYLKSNQSPDVNDAKAKAQQLIDFVNEEVKLFHMKLENEKEKGSKS